MEPSPEHDVAEVVSHELAAEPAGLVSAYLFGSLAEGRAHREIFCSDAAADHAFVRDVQLRAADLEPFLRRLRRVKLEALASSRCSRSVSS